MWGCPPAGRGCLAGSGAGCALLQVLVSLTSWRRKRRFDNSVSSAVRIKLWSQSGILLSMD